MIFFIHITNRCTYVKCSKFYKTIWFSCSHEMSDKRTLTVSEKSMIHYTVSSTLKITNIFVFIKNYHNLYPPLKGTHTRIENMSKFMKSSSDISNCKDPWTLMMETARKSRSFV